MNEAAPAPVTDEALADLVERVRRTRRITNPWADDAGRGLPASELDALLDQWSTRYDWRAHEARILDLPWVQTGAGDEALRSIHQRSADASAPAVVLLHGWPDSILRFERVLPLLDDVNVIVPALPGFPFSLPTSGAMSVNRIADSVAAALGELGYERYVVSGGDVGGMVAEVLAAKYPDRVAALHLTNVAPAHAAAVDVATLRAEAVAYLGVVGAWRQAEAGFIAEQATRPSTLIAGLADSPAGLLAWVGEKLTAWAGGGSAGAGNAAGAGDAVGAGNAVGIGGTMGLARDGADGTAPAFSRDDLLTWVSAYWFTGTIGTSFSTYVERTVLPARVETPTVVSAFAHDIIPAPRSFADHFVNVCDFIAHPTGGHFAAWELPTAYTTDLRRALSLSLASSLANPHRVAGEGSQMVGAGRV